MRKLRSLANLEEISNLEEYQQLCKVFNSETVGLLLSVILEDEEVLFYDDVFEKGGITVEGLMEIVSSQPYLYGLLEEIGRSTEMLIEARSAEKYERDVSAIVCNKKGSAQREKHLSQIVGLSNSIGSIIESLGVGDGMIRTILLNRLRERFDFLYFQRLCLAAEKLGVIEEFLDIFPTENLESYHEHPDFDAETTNIYSAPKKNKDQALAISFLNSEAFVKGLSDTAEGVDCTEDGKEAALALAGERVMVQGAEKIGDFCFYFRTVPVENPANSAFILAFVYVDLGIGAGDRWFFEILRNGAICLNESRSFVDDLFENERDSLLFKATIYKAFKAHLQNCPEIEYINEPEAFKVEVRPRIEASSGVALVIEKKDISLKELGSISYSELARRLERLGIGIDRQGKHPIYIAKNGLTAPVPFHGGDIPRGTLKSILKLLNVSVRELKEV